jgi:formate hydrogenlyase subunit 6/NADH:ubiquinone oxidoreductase subunit I
MSLIKEALQQLVKKPCTTKYPVEKSTPSTGFRGLPKWDMEKCLLCVLCQNACPPNAIKLVGKGREAEISFSMDRCIFCAECAEVCPKGAVTMSGNFELAGTDRGDMVSMFRKKTPIQEPKKASEEPAPSSAKV